MSLGFLELLHFLCILLLRLKLLVTTCHFITIKLTTFTIKLCVIRRNKLLCENKTLEWYDEAFEWSESNNLTSFTTTILCEWEIQVGPDFYCMRRWARSEFSSFFSIQILTWWLNITFKGLCKSEMFRSTRNHGNVDVSKCPPVHMYSNSWQMEGVI